MEIQRINNLHCSENLRVPYFIEELLAQFTVIGGTASQELAKTIAKKLKANYVKTDLRIFPDGKSKITLTSKPKKCTSRYINGSSGIGILKGLFDETAKYQRSYWRVNLRTP